MNLAILCSMDGVNENGSIVQYGWVGVTKKVVKKVNSLGWEVLKALKGKAVEELGFYR